MYYYFVCILITVDMSYIIDRINRSVNNLLLAYKFTLWKFLKKTVKKTIYY